MVGNIVCAVKEGYGLPGFTRFYPGFVGHNEFCVEEQGGVDMALAAEWCLPPVLNVLIHRRG